MTLTSVSVSVTKIEGETLGRMVNSREERERVVPTVRGSPIIISRGR